MKLGDSFEECLLIPMFSLSVTDYSWLFSPVPLTPEYLGIVRLSFLMVTLCSGSLGPQSCLWYSYSVLIKLVVHILALFAWKIWCRIS